MSWAETVYLEDQLKPYDSAYIPGSQKGMYFDRGARIIPIDEVYGLNNPKCNYAKPLSYKSYFRIYKQLIGGNSLRNMGLYPTSKTDSYSYTSYKPLTTDTMTLVKTFGIENYSDFDDVEATEYAVALTGTIYYRYVATSGFKVYLVFDGDTDNAVLLQTSTTANSKTSGTNASYFTALKIDSSVNIPQYSGTGNAKPRTVQLYVVATRYGSSYSPYYGYCSGIQAKLCKYTTEDVPTFATVSMAWLYYDSPSSYEASIDVSTLLYGIKTDEGFYNVCDGTDYYICDSVNVYTGLLTRRVGTGSEEISGETTVTVSSGICDMSYARFYANGQSFEISASSADVTLTFEEAFTGTIYWSAPLIEETSGTAEVEKDLDAKVGTGTPYDVESGLLLKYYYAKSEQGDLILNSFYSASENIPQIKDILAGVLTISGRQASLRNILEDPERDYITNLKAEKLTNPINFARPEFTSAITYFHGGSVCLAWDMDADTLKNYVRSYLADDPTTPITSTAIVTDTSSVTYFISIYKYTEGTGYIYYYGYNYDTYLSTAQYQRSFSVSTDGVITWGSAYTVCAAESSTVSYYFNEMSNMYDISADTQFTEKCTYDSDYSAVTSVYTLLTRYFDIGGTATTTPSSTITVGTQYYQSSSARTDTFELGMFSYSCSSITFGDNNIYFKLKSGGYNSLPYLVFQADVYNSSDDCTSTTYKAYWCEGCYRDNPATSSFTSLDDLSLVPNFQARDLCTIIWHKDYGAVYICFKRIWIGGLLIWDSSSSTYTAQYDEDWVDLYLEARVYDPTALNFVVLSEKTVSSLIGIS